VWERVQHRTSCNLLSLPYVSRTDNSIAVQAHILVVSVYVPKRARDRRAVQVVLGGLVVLVLAKGSRVQTRPS
jgi:hypothetical protein